jgi:cell wall-associated NlpC family hydrolase
VFKDAGVAIPYSENAGRLAKNLDEDSNYMKIDNKEDMQAGDIILFPGGGPSGIHVGITAEDYTEPSWEWGNWGGGISVYHEQGKYVKPLKTNYTGYELDHTKKFKGAYRYIGE